MKTPARLAGARSTDAILPSATPSRERKCACGAASAGPCRTCQRKHADPRLPSAPIRKPADGRSDPAAGASGRALDASLAGRFRSGLGPLIDRVRIHDDAQGAEVAVHSHDKFCAAASALPMGTPRTY